MGSYRWAGDVGQVSSDTGRVHYIVESELSDELAGLEEEGQWLCHVNHVLELALVHVYLSNATSGTSNNGLDHLVELSREGLCNAGAG